MSLSIFLEPPARETQAFGSPLTLGQTNNVDAADIASYGAYLFQSRDLSRDRSLSCASCHVPEFGYSSAAPTAIGFRGAVGPRHAPPLINLADEPLLMFDGRASDLEHQIPIPLESPTEMAIDWPVALKRLQTVPETVRILAYLGRKELDRNLVISSLAAYVRTLKSTNSPFDRYYYRRDETAISEDAQRGLRVFVRKGRCASCHVLDGVSAPLTDAGFHSIGIGWRNGRYADPGRFDVTKDPHDLGAFKTPTLRNVAQRRYFMHDGSMSSLRQVIDYYNRGGNEAAPNLDGRIHPLFLTEQDIRDLIAFLDTLTGPIGSEDDQASAADTHH